MTAIDTTIATRFDTRDTEEGTELRVFHKRSLIGRMSEDDIVLEDWDSALSEFIAAEARTFADIEEFLTTEAEEGDDAEDEEEREPGSIVPEEYRIRYGSTQRCGDDVAEVLTACVTLPRANKNNPDGGLDRAKLRGVAEINGIGDKLAGWEDNGLNGGLLRMNTSNVLRGMVRRGERVEIGATVWEADPAKMEARIAAKKERAKARREAKKG